MMGVWWSLSGMVEVELTSADPSGALQAVSQAEIPVHQSKPIGELVLRFLIHRQDYRRLSALAEKRGETLRLVHRRGIYWRGKVLFRRPVLLMGLLLLLAGILWLPGRIFFVQVDGNETIPTRLILAEAESCGIEFGALRREVRSEKMKNALLAAIPELQWAGVNTKGCVAVISVREKTVLEETEQPVQVSRIVASRDGVIIGCTVKSGNALCKPGQAVRKGQILVSGYTDCGIVIRATRSDGEIFAQTEWNLEAVTPGEYLQKGSVIRREKKYAVIIGKKRINFYKDSGISGGTCDKMSEVNYLTLPGGFVLPAALVTEEVTYYETASVQADAMSVQPLLEEFTRRYLKQQMIAGRILQEKTEIVPDGKSHRLWGQFSCCEMIGREQIMEDLEPYGKSD